MKLKCSACQRERDFEIIKRSPLIIFTFVGFKSYGRAKEETNQITLHGRIFIESEFQFNLKNWVTLEKGIWKKSEEIEVKDSKYEGKNLIIDKLQDMLGYYNIISTYQIRNEKKIRIDKTKEFLLRRLKRIIKEIIYGEK